MIVDNPPQALTTNLWMLGSSAYPLYLFHAGHEAAIFEGGTSAVGPMLGEQWQQLGIDSTTLTQIVITHGHPDHVMAVPQLRALFPGASVLASKVAAATLASEKAMAVFRQIDEALTASLLNSGLIGPDQRPEVVAGDAIGVDRVLQEGDVVEVGDMALDVLETPGHSDCSLSFYERRLRILLLSDATGYYVPKDRFWWPNYFGDYAAYLASIERLAALEVEVLCLSHNAAICGAEDVRDYFRGAVDATQQYHAGIVEAARSGKTVRQIAEQLGSEIHGRTPLLPVEFFQKNCGLMVKHSLRYAGMAPDH